MTLNDIFDDAHRRVCIAKQRGADLRNAWHGLAMPSNMGPAVRRGWMRHVYPGAETPRVLNWYQLTDSGWAEYERRYAGKPDYFDAQEG